MKVRIDSKALAESVETVRRYRKESLTTVAKKTAVPRSTFYRLREGHQPSLVAYLAILRYLNREAPFALLVRAPQ